MKRRAAVAGAGVIAYIGAVRRWQLRWGASDEELGATLAGDDIITNPDLRATRAVTVHAVADQVWPWIAQLGQGRGGFYSYDGLKTWLAATFTVRTGSSPSGRTSRWATRSSSTPKWGWPGRGHRTYGGLLVFLWVVEE
jgi:hypothetical protein